jgi:NAD(P)-dependent dehydrogenase (short-subunit alcohol dehydrogenase family)
MERFSLTNRVAFVTGAGRGIGRVLALGLAEAGADVVCVARTQVEIESTAQAIRELGRRAIAVTADVTQAHEVQAAVDAAVSHLGTIDILVNNAGMNIRTPALELSEAHWDAIVDTNLKGPFLVAQAVGRVMCANKYGRVINIASVGGRLALRTGVAYGASKAALLHMTRVLALEWAPFGVTVNAVGPWYFKTSVTDKVLNDPRFSNDVISRTPLGRVGELEELLGPAIFLASDASGYITGQSLYVDGGMSIIGF